MEVALAGEAPSVLLCLGVDRTNRNHEVGAGPHPLPNECAMRLVCREPETSRRCPRSGNHHGHVIDVRNDDGVAPTSAPLGQKGRHGVLARGDRSRIVMSEDVSAF